MIEYADGLHKLFFNPSGSRSNLEDGAVGHGFEIKKDELYVIGGDTLIKAYKLLSAQRISSLLQINNMPPTYIKEIEHLVGIFTHINRTMYEILNAIEHKKLKEMERKVRRPLIKVDSAQADFADFMKDFLTRNKINLDGNINDDGTEAPPIPPEDTSE